MGWQSEDVSLRWPWLVVALALLVVALLVWWALSRGSRPPTGAAYVAHATRLRTLPRFQALVQQRRVIGTLVSIAALVTAAAAAALMAGAAHAGEKMKTQTSAEGEQPAAADIMSTDASAMTPDTTAAADTGSASDASAVVSANAQASDASAVVTTNMVTNGPIDDTPENRAKYGQPLSHAGKRTLAKGN